VRSALSPRQPFIWLTVNYLEISITNP